MTQAGTLPEGQELALVLGEQRVDWRNVLLRYLTPTQDDYGAFDTRLIYYGLYVETLGSTGVQVAVHIDTSGSLADACIAGAVFGRTQGHLERLPQRYGDADLR